jgi:hypothetical protein
MPRLRTAGRICEVVQGGTKLAEGSPQSEQSALIVVPGALAATYVRAAGMSWALQAGADAAKKVESVWLLVN